MKISPLVFALLATVPLTANAAITFTSTADGKPISIPAASFDTPAAKEFLTTGKNTYIGNADAIKAGKKTFQLYSCTACHGAHGEGAVGPNLIDDKWNYAKNAEDHGIFETIWSGTSGGMGAKGKGLMQPDDPTQGLTTDEVLKVVAFIRSNAVSAAPASIAPKVEAAPAAVDSTSPVVPANKTVKKPVKTSTKKPTKTSKPAQ